MQLARFSEIRFLAFSALFFTILCTGVFSEDFSSSMSRFDQNQKKILTFVGKGTMNIDIYSTAQGSILKSLSSGLTIYLKSPDKVKIAFSGQADFAMVQQGDFITQKMPGSKTLVTSKATNTTDLFNKYLNNGISKNASSVQIIGSSSVIEGDVVLQKYTTQNNTAAPQSVGQAIKIDKTEFYFDPNDMLVRIVSTDHGALVTRTDYTYQKIGTVFVTNQIQTTIISQQTKIVNTISYNAVSVNTTVLDSEFDLTPR